MRLILGLALGLAMAFFGLAGLAAGIDEMLRLGATEDAWAMLIIGGLMFFAGVITGWISVKAHRRRRALKAGRPVAPLAQGEIEGTLFGVGMATFMNDIGAESGDDGGGFDD